MSLGIVETHGGTLTVDCPDEGGAVFTISLPVGTVEARGVDAAPTPKTSAHGLTILVVDDEAEIRETLAEILSGARHRVVTASSGREALERLATQHYDVILTDIRMPDLDGRALYQEIEQRWPGLGRRVVFVTGDTLASASREFVSDSGRPVIEKPFRQRSTPSRRRIGGERQCSGCRLRIVRAALRARRRPGFRRPHPASP